MTSRASGASIPRKTRSSSSTPLYARILPTNRNTRWAMSRPRAARASGGRSCPGTSRRSCHGARPRTGSRASPAAGRRPWHWPIDAAQWQMTTSHRSTIRRWARISGPERESSWPPMLWRVQTTRTPSRRRRPVAQSPSAARPSDSLPSTGREVPVGPVEVDDPRSAGRAPLAEDGRDRPAPGARCRG